MGAISTQAITLKALPDESKERTAEEIRQEISNHREAISNTINRLDDRIQEAVDWRTHVADHPYVALGIAAGAGLIVAGMFKHKASPQDRIMDALADGIEDVSLQARNRFGSLLNTVAPRHNSTLQGAVAAFAAKAAIDFLRGKIIDQLTSPRKPQTS